MALSLGPTWADAIWKSPYRLRFELGTDGGDVEAFTRAYDRARELARAALRIERPVAVIADVQSVAALLRANAGTTANDSSFDALARMGVPTDAAEATWTGCFRVGDERACEHRAVSVSWSEADILLWNNIAQEIGVRPVAPLLSKLADAAGGIVVNAYDDRGMDITALAPAAIRHLYERYEDWLLDFDRLRMAAVFGPAEAARDE
jgi:hypothetical protein